MNHKLAKMKETLLDYADQQLQRGVESVDAREMGMVTDMIKDLAEAEKCCAEAEYYDSVVGAMDGGHGYDGHGYTPGAGNGRMASGSGRMGYKNQYGSSWRANPSNRRRGYSEESVENLRMMMQDADPQRKEQLRRDLEDLMREM